MPGIDLLIRLLNLALEDCLFLGQPGGCEAPVQLEHGFDEGDHAVVAGKVGGVGEIGIRRLQG